MKMAISLAAMASEETTKAGVAIGVAASRRADENAMSASYLMAKSQPEAAAVHRKSQKGEQAAKGCLCSLANNGGNGIGGGARPHRRKQGVHGMKYRQSAAIL